MPAPPRLTLSDLVAEERVFADRGADLVRLLDADRPERDAGLDKAAAATHDQALALKRAAGESIEAAAKVLRAGGMPDCPIGPRKHMVGAVGGTDLPPLNEPLPDESLALAEYVADVDGPAELVAARAAAAHDPEVHGALRHAVLEHVARMVGRLTAHSQDRGADALHRSLDLWQTSWQKAEKAVTAAQARMARAEAEAERIAHERLLAQLPSHVPVMTPGDLAAIDRAGTAFVAREQATRRQARVAALSKALDG